jgi:hypothetical protein
MKKQSRQTMPRNVLLAVAFAAAASAAVSATSWTQGNGYQIINIRPGGDRPCTLFQLSGIAQADPSVPGSAWFAIPPGTPGYKEMVATLLTAKATGRGIHVVTTGGYAPECGHPSVAVLLLP